jgi:hypothetical protein
MHDSILIVEQDRAVPGYDNDKATKQLGGYRNRCTLQAKKKPDCSGFFLLIKKEN